MYHEPVLLSESVEGLSINPNGIYIDVTFGGGGHSREILKNISTGKLYAFDQDTDANNNILENNSFKLLNTNFRNIKNFLRLEGVNKIDEKKHLSPPTIHQFYLPLPILKSF